jgi:hypothetical protein
MLLAMTILCHFDSIEDGWRNPFLLIGNVCTYPELNRDLKLRKLLLCPIKL